MNFNIAVFAGAAAAAALGITFTIQPEAPSAPQEPRAVEQSSTPAPEFRSHLPEISPSAEAIDTVYHYH